MNVLEKLEAIEDIRQLKSRYFRFVDTKDWDGLSTIFCEDAIFDARCARRPEPDPESAGSLYEGMDAVLAILRKGIEWSTSVHHGHGHEIVIDSQDEAHGIIAMQDVMTWDRPKQAYLHGYGHYHEIYRREHGAWRIWRTTLTRLRVDSDL